MPATDVDPFRLREIVARALNSHLSKDMHKLYSTVSQREMNEAVAAVIDLVGYREAMGR